MRESEKVELPRQSLLISKSIKTYAPNLFLVRPTLFSGCPFHGIPLAQKPSIHVTRVSKSLSRYPVGSEGVDLHSQLAPFSRYPIDSEVHFPIDSTPIKLIKICKKSFKQEHMFGIMGTEMEV